MKKFIKTTYLILSLMLALTFAGCDNRNFSEYKEGDFVLEISVNETTASIESEIEVSVVFKNASGRDISVWFDAFMFLGLFSGKIDDMICTLVCPEGMDYGWSIGTTLEYSLLPKTTQIGMTRKKIKKDTVIEVTRMCGIVKFSGYDYEGLGEGGMIYDAYAEAVFYTSKGKTEQNIVKSNIIKIIVN